MCDKDFCTLYSLFMLALARKELSACSFRLFIGEKPILLQTVEELATKVTCEDWKEAFSDEWGVKYSKDGRKLLGVPLNLRGTYSVKGGTKIISDRAFSNCSSLKYISIPKSVICLNGNPFNGWIGKLECLSPNFIYEDDVLFNKDKSKIISFRNQNIESYIIPTCVASIGDHAFSDCSSLSNIVIPNSVTRIGEGAFFNCSSLSNIVIPNSVTSIEKGAFSSCRSLSDIVILDGVTRIGEGAFSGCCSLSNIVIPNSVTSIGDRAFWGCRSLKYISIPKSVICLNGNPFYGWIGKLECLSPNFIYEDDILYNKDKSKIISFRNQSLESFIIPTCVTSIGDSAFFGCSSLSDIVILDSVTSIGDCAFSYCSSLSNIVIPDSVTSIGDSAFRHCI